MGLLRKLSEKGKAETPPTPIKKYNYAQFLANDGQPSTAAVNTAAMYSQRAATSAALQAQVESSKRPLGPPSRRQSRRMCAPGRIWMHMLTMFQIAVAVGVIAVVAASLEIQEEVEGIEGQPPTTVSVCLATTRSVNICSYAYWASGASIALSLLISVMNLCCPGRKHAFCLSLEALCALIGAAWWTASAITTIIFAKEADNAGLEGGTSRMVLWILCWVNAGLFGLSFLTSAAGCCGAWCALVDEDDDLDP